MSENPTDVVEQYLIDNTKVSRARGHAEEIVAALEMDHEIIPRPQYEALMAAAIPFIRAGKNLAPQDLPDSHVIGAGLTVADLRKLCLALAALRAAGIDLEEKP